MDASASSIRKRRVFRQVEEKLRIVKLALEPGASVASVASSQRSEREPGISLEATV